LIDQLLYPNAVATIVSDTSDADSFFALLMATDLAFLLFATAVGGYIARTNFVVPAMMYAGADFTYGVYRGIRLGGQPVELVELDLSFAPFALLGFIAVLAVAATGSIAGMKLHVRVNRQGLSAR